MVNQPPLLLELDLYDSDVALKDGLRREGGGWDERGVREYARVMGSAEMVKAGELANRYPPELRSHDRFGHRIDEVEFHPAWHDIMQLNLRHRVHNLPWHDGRPGAHVARTARHYILSQVEAGSACPVTMTYACMPVIRQQPEVAAEWEQLLLGDRYDPRCVPSGQKQAVMVGMAMTEKQGGSDVRSNSTVAEPVDSGGPGTGYFLNGQKWFCSAPMSDAFLVLAQAPGGLSCFLVPRWRDDGVRNGIQLQRLKDKLGNRSNASAEIELRGAWGRMVGEEGRGVATILGMVQLTRLDCVSGSAGLMRQALSQALYHCRHRQAFGKRLVEQPLMLNVLADIALESEAATLLALRLARAVDAGEKESAFSRVATAVGKYWVCRRAETVAAEAMECLGGGGYVEESVMPRIFREAPVNAIWEGSGNVICLDVLRAATKEEGAIEAFVDEVRLGAEQGNGLAVAADTISAALKAAREDPSQARLLVEKMATALQASLLARYSPAPLVEAFVATRLSCAHLGMGTLPPGVDLPALVGRAVVDAEG